MVFLKKIWSMIYFKKIKYSEISSSFSVSVCVNIIQKDLFSFSSNMWLSYWVCFTNKLVTGLGGEEGERMKEKEQSWDGGCFEDESEKKESCHVW